MTGMPTRAIVLAVGSGEGDSWLMRSAAMLMMPPVSIEAGMMTLCDDVPNIHLAMCGAVMPTKPSGPQKAVTAPVIMQQLRRAVSLMFPTFAPPISANSSPNSMMSRPLRPAMASAVPIRTAMASVMMSDQVVVEKLPADQL